VLKTALPAICGGVFGRVVYIVLGATHSQRATGNGWKPTGLRLELLAKKKTRSKGKSLSTNQFVDLEN